MSVYDSNKACFSHEQTKLFPERFTPGRNDLKKISSSEHANIIILGNNQFE
jgi:hypothetical protein